MNAEDMPPFTRAELIQQLRKEEAALNQAIETCKTHSEIREIYARMKVIYERLLDWNEAVAWVDVTDGNLA
jgi:hypothetical protein